eukprot:9635402-Alexandrium_andersonii.AAC.1
MPGLPTGLRRGPLHGVLLHLAARGPPPSCSGARPRDSLRWLRAPQGPYVPRAPPPPALR